MEEKAAKTYDLDLDVGISSHLFTLTVGKRTRLSLKKWRIWGGKSKLFTLEGIADDNNEHSYWIVILELFLYIAYMSLNCNIGAVFFFRFFLGTWGGNISAYNCYLHGKYNKGIEEKKIYLFKIWRLCLIFIGQLIIMADCILALKGEHSKML